MMVLFLLGCTGVVVLLHGANFFFHALSSHLAFRSLSNVKKEPGISWIEVKDEVYTFIVGDRNHFRSTEIHAKLDELRDLMNKPGYVPMVENDLHDVGKSEKELLLSYHHEKLAVAFGLIATPSGAPIRVKKNL